MDPRFSPSTEPPRRKSKVSLSQLLAHVRATDQREGLYGFVFNSPAPSIVSSRNSSLSRRRSSLIAPNSRRASDRSVMLVTSCDSESDSDCDCRSAITASSIGSFTRKGSGTPSHLRCIVEVDGEKPVLTTTNYRKPSLPTSHDCQRRTPPFELRCVVDVSRDDSLPSLDSWTFTSPGSAYDIKTPSSADSFACKGGPLDDHLGSKLVLPLEKSKRPPMSAPATEWTTGFEEDVDNGPPPVIEAALPRKFSMDNTKKKPRRLAPLPTIVTNLPSTVSFKCPPIDQPPDYSLIDPALELHHVKASRRRGGLFSPLQDDACSPRALKQKTQAPHEVQPPSPSTEGSPRTVRQKIKNGIASIHGKTNSTESMPRKALGDTSSRNNSLEGGGQTRKTSLPKPFRKKSPGSRKKSLPSAWFDDDECLDGSSSDEEGGITLIVPAGIQTEVHSPFSTQALTGQPFDPDFSFSRRCKPRLSVSEAPAPRRNL